MLFLKYFHAALFGIQSLCVIFEYTIRAPWALGEMYLADSETFGWKVRNILCSFMCARFR